MPRIKGTHNAVRSRHAGGRACRRRRSPRAGRGDELGAYEDGWRDSAIGDDLKKVRNAKPLWSKLGTLWGVAIGGIDMWITTLFGGWSPFGTMSHGKADHEATEPASRPQADRPI